MATMKFKTNAKCGGCVAAIGAKLNKLVKEDEWSVDLKSPDKVLEVTADVPADKIILSEKDKHHECLEEASWLFDYNENLY